MPHARAAMYVLAALAIFLGGYGIRALQAPGPAAPAPELEQRIEQLEQRLGPTPGAAPAGGIDTATTAIAAGSARPPADASPLGRRPVPMRELARLRQARLAELDASFRQESAEPAAASVEARLADAAASDDLVASGITPSAIDAQCRARSCRVLARFPAGADAEGWASLYVLGASGTLAKAQAIVTPAADGTLELALYGTRN